MAQVGKLESTVSVRFPEMRLRLRQAVNTLCDRELHERLWIRGERASSSELGFDDTLLFLVDEMEMFAPTDLVGDVLVDDAELDAFLCLSAALGGVVDAIGEHGTYADALKVDEAWQAVLEAARLMRNLLDR